MGDDTMTQRSPINKIGVGLSPFMLAGWRTIMDVLVEKTSLGFCAFWHKTGNLIPLQSWSLSLSSALIFSYCNWIPHHFLFSNSFIRERFVLFLFYANSKVWGFFFFITHNSTWKKLDVWEAFRVVLCGTRRTNIRRCLLDGWLLLGICCAANPCTFMTHAHTQNTGDRDKSPLFDTVGLYCFQVQSSFSSRSLCFI